MLEVQGVRIHDRGDRIAIVARTRRHAIDLAIDRPAGWQSLGVATAWDDRHYAYSSKQVALPARGTVDGRALAPGAFACLDWGRGVWPVRTSWNWASFAGVVGGRTIGVNLGARWTRGVTENALLVDGVIEKLAEEVTFTPGAVARGSGAASRAPWRLTGGRVDLALAPEQVDGARIPGLGSLAIAFGTFTGTVAGAAIPGLFGWAEELHVRW